MFSPTARSCIPLPGHPGAHPTACPQLEVSLVLPLYLSIPNHLMDHLVTHTWIGRALWHRNWQRCSCCSIPITVSIRTRHQYGISPTRSSPDPVPCPILSHQRWPRIHLARWWHREWVLVFVLPSDLSRLVGWPFYRPNHRVVACIHGPAHGRGKGTGSTCNKSVWYGSWVHRKSGSNTYPHWVLEAQMNEFGGIVNQDIGARASRLSGGSRGDVRGRRSSNGMGDTPFDMRVHGGVHWMGVSETLTKMQGGVNGFWVRVWADEMGEIGWGLMKNLDCLICTG